MEKHDKEKERTDLSKTASFLSESVASLSHTSSTGASASLSHTSSTGASALPIVFPSSLVAQLPPPSTSVDSVSYNYSASTTALSPATDSLLASVSATSASAGQQAPPSSSSTGSSIAAFDRMGASLGPSSGFLRPVELTRKDELERLWKVAGRRLSSSGSSSNSWGVGGDGSSKVGEDLAGGGAIASSSSSSSSSSFRASPPPITLPTPCIINWIDSKSTFGDPQTHSENLEQLLGYVNRFGPGLVIYWHDFVDSIRDSTPPEILISNKLPDLWILPGD